MKRFCIAGSLLLLATGGSIGCGADGAATSTSSVGGAGVTSSGSTGPTAAATATASAGSGTGGMGAGGMGAFTLTSSGFTEGSAIPSTFACAPGMNLSPDLNWTGGPLAQSYAVILTDKSNSLIHWAIWDIPSTATGLAEHVAQAANPPTPAGAKQAKSYDNATFGYLGPCPPTTHTYQFVVYAIDIATLPGVTTDSTRPEVEAAVMNHDLASASLSGTYTP